MARKNIKEKETVFTHGGGVGVAPLTSKDALRRITMACMLWENQFYVDGKDVPSQIKDLVPKVAPSDVAEIAIEAREQMHVRHVPLLLVREMARHPSHRALVGSTLERVIKRADELSEFLAIYWDGKLGANKQRKVEPVAAQVKKGLAAAFSKFDAYQLGKYNRARSATAVTLGDVLTIARPKPKDADQAALWKSLLDGNLKAPDTWEVNLSGGADKRETFERLIADKKLGYLALLRNLSGMTKAGVSRDLIREAIKARVGAGRVLPFRFIAAAKAAPEFEPDLDQAMVAALAERPKLAGKSIIVVDVSGSMAGSISGKSTMTNMDAAAALAAIARELCEDPVIYATAGNDSSHKHATIKVPARHGNALRDAIVSTRSKIGQGGIFIAQVMDFLKKEEKRADRVIVLTDEQDCDIGDRSPMTADTFGKENYIVNVSSYRNGVAVRGKWDRVDGFSDATISWIMKKEGAEVVLDDEEPKN